MRPSRCGVECACTRFAPPRPSWPRPRFGITAEFLAVVWAGVRRDVIALSVGAIVGVGRVQRHRDARCRGPHPFGDREGMRAVAGTAHHRTRRRIGARGGRRSAQRVFDRSESVKQAPSSFALTAVSRTFCARRQAGCSVMSRSSPGDGSGLSPTGTLPRTASRSTSRALRRRRAECCVPPQTRGSSGSERGEASARQIDRIWFQSSVGNRTDQKGGAVSDDEPLVSAMADGLLNELAVVQRLPGQGREQLEPTIPRSDRADCSLQLAEPRRVMVVEDLRRCASALTAEQQRCTPVVGLLSAARDSQPVLCRPSFRVHCVLVGNGRVVSPRRSPVAGHCGTSDTDLTAPT